MALPIIKAKSYNYGSYANPQQVKFRKGIGAQIGDEFGAGLVKGMQEKRAEKKREEREIKKFNENVDEWGVKAKVSGLKELGPDATEKSRKQLSLAIDALRPERGDTVDDKVKKELALEKLFTDIRVMKKTQELDFDAKGKNLASSSQADFINGANAADGLYDMNFNKETLEMEFSILEVDPYSGSAIPSMSMKRIDPTSFLEKVSNLNTKYDSLELTDKLQLNDVTKAPKILQNLYNSKKEQFAPLTREVVQPDGSKDVYFDQSLVKNYLNSEDPNSQMGKFINGAVEVKGQTIWEDTLGKKGFDKNNPEHIAEVKDVVAGDIAKKYSEYTIGSIAAPKNQTVDLSEGDIRRNKALNTAQNFEKQLKDSLISYNNSVGSDEPDILPLQGLFRSKSHNKLGVINEVIEGSADNPNNFTFVFDKKDSQGNPKTRTVDFTDKNEFDNFISEIGFVDSATYNQDVIDYIKSIPALFGLSEKEKSIKAIKDAEGEITPETLDIKTDLIQDRLLQANRGFRQRQLRD